MKYSYIIWDWNGTLLDDVETNLRTADDMLSKRGLPVIGDEERYRRMFCFPVIDFYRKAGFDLTEEDFRVMAEEYVETYRKNLGLSRLFGDVKETLDAFSKAGLCQAILSATEEKRLRSEVATHGICGYFDGVLGVSDNLGSSKADRARAFVKESGLSRGLFIGDTIHDAEVARECGCECALVARGHMDRTRLESTGCEVFDSLSQLARYVLD